MFVKSTRFKQVCQLLLSLIVFNIFSLLSAVVFLPHLSVATLTQLFEENRTIPISEPPFSPFQNFRMKQC